MATPTPDSTATPTVDPTSSPSPTPAVLSNETTEPPGPNVSENTNSTQDQVQVTEAKTLPKTGESSSVPFYILGSVITALGIIFRKTAKRN
ncbi:LPXTG cell wall anchor domain-containing protein [Paenibacillus haidiansis]|uniref:LPXTG cell wall anchor domain-containing protein n=1 Tax=Paenibacillus haidiansis TaxID=1574488 RepID=UPI0039DF7E97